MTDRAASGTHAADQRDPVPPAPPVAPNPLGLVVWGTGTVVAGVLLCVLGPVGVLVLAPELAYSLGVGGWVDGLLRVGAVALAVVAGLALITLGRGVRALAWLTHRALAQDATTAAGTPAPGGTARAT